MDAAMANHGRIPVGQVIAPIVAIGGCVVALF